MLHNRRHLRGFVMIYAMFAMIVLMGFTSLAVDWGRVETAKTELQDATDAAARYAVTGISDSTATSKAISAASQNQVDGSSLVLLSSDIDVGTWDSSARSFSVGGSMPNAVRVMGHRTKARGTAIQLLLAKAVGASTCDVNATSIATYTAAAPTANIVGLSSVTFYSGGKIQRLGSETGTVNVASNGTFTLSWGQQIAGNVLYRGSPPSTPNGSNCITGTTTLMSSNLACATPTVPGGSIAVGAANYGSGQTVSVPSGNYSATSLTVGGGATLNLGGDVNVYCSGAVDIGNGAVVNTNNGAYRFTIYQTTASTVNFNVGTIYGRIYAPLSNVTINGGTVLIGSVICNNLSVYSNISYSSTLPSPIAPTGGGGGSGTVSMVK